MKHSEIVEELEQGICAYVIFTNEEGTVMSVDLFKDYRQAADFFDSQVKEAFEGIRRDFPKARNIQESVGPDDVTHFLLRLFHLNYQTDRWRQVMTSLSAKSDRVMSWAVCSCRITAPGGWLGSVDI